MKTVVQENVLLNLTDLNLKARLLWNFKKIYHDRNLTL